MTENTLGTEFSQYKINYLIFLVAVFFVYFFLWIGMQNDPIYQNQAPKLMFYIGFGFIVGLIPFVVDLLSNKNIDLPLDTISYENNSPLKQLNSFWVQVIASTVLSAFIWLRIRISNEAFVKAPSFSLTIPYLSDLGLSQKLISGFVSGLTAGVVESIVFFGFIMPVLYAIMKKIDVPDMVAVVLCIIFSAGIFTGYHFWAYGYIISALLSVFVFGILQGVFAYMFRSMVPLFMTHFINNFAVNLLVLSAYVVQVIL